MRTLCFFEAMHFFYNKKTVAHDLSCFTTKPWLTFKCTTHHHEQLRPRPFHPGCWRSLNLWKDRGKPYQNGHVKNCQIVLIWYGKKTNSLEQIQETCWSTQLTPALRWWFVLHGIKPGGVLQASCSPMIRSYQGPDYTFHAHHQHFPNDKRRFGVVGKLNRYGTCWHLQ